MIITRAPNYFRDLPVHSYPSFTARCTYIARLIFFWAVLIE